MVQVEPFGSYGAAAPFGVITPVGGRLVRTRY